MKKIEYESRWKIGILDWKSDEAERFKYLRVMLSKDGKMMMKLRKNNSYEHAISSKEKPTKE